MIHWIQEMECVSLMKLDVSFSFLVKLGTPAKILQFLLGSIKLNTTDDRMGKQLPEACNFFMDFCQFETWTNTSYIVND